MSRGTKALIAGGTDEIARIFADLAIATVVARDVSEVRALARAIERWRFVLTKLALPDGNWRDVIECFAGSGTPVVVYAPRTASRLWWDVLDSGGHDVLDSLSHQDVLRMLNDLDPDAGASAEATR